MDSILLHEITVVLDELYQILSASLAFFHSPCFKYPWKYSSNGTSYEAITGNVLLHEDTLCSMEILVKPVRGASAMKATFREDKQWKLQQIQDAMNHLKHAADILISFTISQKKSSTPYCKERVAHVLDTVSSNLKSCRIRLFSPSKLSLKAMMNNAILRMFTPPLPQDTLVNLYVLEDRLVLMYYKLRQVPVTAGTSAGNPATGAVVDHGHLRYEVAAIHKAESIIPWLSRILYATEISLQMSSNLKNKIEISCKK